MRNSPEKKLYGKECPDTAKTLSAVIFLTFLFSIHNSQEQNHRNDTISNCIELKNTNNNTTAITIKSSTHNQIIEVIQSETFHEVDQKPFTLDPNEPFLIAIDDLPLSCFKPTHTLTTISTSTPKTENSYYQMNISPDDNYSEPNPIYTSINLTIETTHEIPN